jgi:GT2 family glycosyltransferase
MSTDRKVAIAILGHNHRKYLNALLCSVLDQSYGSYSVYYIDNASTDNSYEYVKEHFRAVTSVYNKKNTGYAGAYDAVLRNIFKSDYDGVVLLNPDTIVHRDFLAELVNTAYKNDNIAIAQSKIYLLKEKEKTYDSIGNKIHYIGFGYCNGYGTKEKQLLVEDKFIDSASGACMLIKKEAYLQSGGFDKDFFAYMEDQDLCWRLRMLGYDIVLSSKSIVWHDHQYDKKEKQKEKFYLLERNRLIFMLKNYGWKLLLSFSIMIILFEICAIIHSILKGYFLKKIKGYSYIICTFSNILEKRKRIQQTRVTQDNSLIQYLSPDINIYTFPQALLKILNTFSRLYYHLIRYCLNTKK